MNRYTDLEFYSLIKPILDNEEYQKTKKISHHGITRFEHSIRVAYFSYKITKTLRLDYQETTEAAMLHDFFLDELDEENKITKLTKHPKAAVENSSKYFDLSDKQIDIIKTHMFPVTFTPPKYLESWIVDIADDIAAIYERTCTLKKDFTTAMTFLFVLLVNIIKMR